MELKKQRATGVNAAMMRVIGRLEQKNARNGNCAYLGSAYYGVLLYCITHYFQSKSCEKMITQNMYNQLLFTMCRDIKSIIWKRMQCTMCIPLLLIRFSDMMPISNNKLSNLCSLRIAYHLDRDPVREGQSKMNKYFFSCH